MLSIEWPTEAPASGIAGVETIAAFVERRVREAGSAGVCVADLRREMNGRDYHEKSLGIALRRLSLRGGCKRIDGTRVWVAT